MYTYFCAFTNLYTTLYTDPSVYSRSIENHAQHTERPKLNGIVQNTFWTVSLVGFVQDVQLVFN